MHAVAGIHSAMAIKRQRHRRELAARERERRLSTHSSESGKFFLLFILDFQFIASSHSDSDMERCGLFGQPERFWCFFSDFFFF